MEQMEYIKIQLHGKCGEGKFTLVDGDYDGEYFSQFRWYLLPNGYVGRDGRYAGKKAYSYLHDEVAGEKPTGYMVDHIDRNKLNNRSCNIRVVTPKENAVNRRQPANSSGKTFRGVVYFKDGRKSPWAARLSGKHLGFYQTEIEAARRYDTEAKNKYGADAVVNGV